MAVSCDPNDLMAQAKCLECGIPDGMDLAVLIYLFCQIANNPSGGGTSVLPNGQIFVGNAANVATPVPMSKDATIDNTGAVTLANTATARSDIGLGTTDTPQFLRLGLGQAAFAGYSLLASLAISTSTFFQGTENNIAASNVDWSLGDFFSKTIAANTTFTFSNVITGRQILVAITGDASHTVTWPAVKWPGGVAPVQTLSKVDIYVFVRMVDGNIYGNATQNMS